MNAGTLLRTVTDPVRRRPGTAVLVGVIAGVFSGIVKFGWEVPFPPRTPERNATNPPQALLELLGVPSDVTHQTYSYLGNDMPWVSFIIHFAFAISFAVLYCVVAEYRPGITLWQGGGLRPGRVGGIPSDRDAADDHRPAPVGAAFRRALL